MPPFPSIPSSFNAAFSLLRLLFAFLIFHHHTPTIASLLSEPVQTNGTTTASSNDSYTVPSFPLQPAPGQLCKLDLSSELFGGVTLACTPVLDRDRCCPVLAAWLFAAHARYALQPPPSALSAEPASAPLVPDDSQKCVDALQDALATRKIRLPRPNATCDTVICFCGIRVHEISSLTCPAAFNVTAEGRGNGKNSSSSVGSGTKTVKPTAAVRDLEKSCKNSSYGGCTRCLSALQKLKGNGTSVQGDRTGRAGRMLDRDCQLMGLTWLLARNKTSYIPTVSAALRAVMYSIHVPPTCSPDRENMPLAVDSLQFDKGNGGLVYDSCTVRRMEALILGALGWRMCSATPFSFISFFVSLFKMKDPPFRQVLRERATEIILKTQNDVELLRYKPSIITASALLSASHELFPVRFQCFRTAIFACSYINKEEFTECYGVMQGVATERYESVLLDDDNVSFGEDTPKNVLDQQFSFSCSTSIGNSCGDTTTTTCMAMSSSSSSSSSTPSTTRQLKGRQIFLYQNAGSNYQSNSLSDSVLTAVHPELISEFLEGLGGPSFLSLLRERLDNGPNSNKIKFWVHFPIMCCH